MARESNAAGRIAMLTVAAVMEYLEQLAPCRLAAEWDNVGLLLGDPEGPVGQVMTCLTLTSEVAAEAVASGVQLIITHHPLLFRPVKRLTGATADGRLLLSLIQARVAVYCPHTAFDNTEGGINDLLARRLKLTEVGPLRPRPGPPQYKIIVFVPEADLARVSGAMFAAGAGHIGQYSQCSFRLAGTGTFFGSEAANPTVGQKGRREEVSEWRLEVVCPHHALTQVISAMRRAHSYEEPAYDVYRLHSSATSFGIGRLGLLPAPLPLHAFAHEVQTRLAAGHVQIVGDPARSVQRVAIVCGAGGEFVADAARKGADVLV